MSEKTDLRTALAGTQQAARQKARRGGGPCWSPADSPASRRRSGWTCTGQTQAVRQRSREAKAGVRQEQQNAGSLEQENWELREQLRGSVTRREDRQLRVAELPKTELEMPELPLHNAPVTREALVARSKHERPWEIRLSWRHVWSS